MMHLFRRIPRLLVYSDQMLRTLPSPHSHGAMGPRLRTSQALEASILSTSPSLQTSRLMGVICSTRRRRLSRSNSKSHSCQLGPLQAWDLETTSLTASDLKAAATRRARGPRRKLLERLQHQTDPIRRAGRFRPVVAARSCPCSRKRSPKCPARPTCIECP